MKIITLHQPWASAIACGLKHYETRSWPTRYRGKIAIHAGKKPMNKQANLFWAGLIRDRPSLSAYHEFGAIVAIADMTACIRMTDEFISQQTEQELSLGDWQPCRYAWKLTNIFETTPISFTGNKV